MANIPKLIHFIWIGNNEKPEIVIKCIESWKKNMPDYTIMEWNESNYDIYKSKYLIQAYSEKKWAFASDYMRFDILYQYGGIYLDTDVELLKKIPREIFEHKSFTGSEMNGKVSPGLIYACQKGDWLASLMLQSYDQDEFKIDNLYTVNQRITDILKKYGYIEKNKLQCINGLTIYPSQIFCGFDTDIMEYDIQESTVAVHHYTGTWSDDKFKRKIQKFVKKILGLELYKKILKMKRCVSRVKENIFGEKNV